MGDTWGWVYCESFFNTMRFSKTITLKAVASTQAQRAVELVGLYSLSPRVEHSYKHLLQSDDIDAVYIANLKAKDWGKLLSAYLIISNVHRRAE